MSLPLREFVCFWKKKVHAFTTGVFPKIGVPQNGWFIMENLIKRDDLEENPLFSETSTDRQVLLHHHWQCFINSNTWEWHQRGDLRFRLLMEPMSRRRRVEIWGSQWFFFSAEVFGWLFWLFFLGGGAGGVGGLGKIISLFWENIQSWWWFRGLRQVKQLREKGSLWFEKILGG